MSILGVLVLTIGWLRLSGFHLREMKDGESWD